MNQFSDEFCCHFQPYLIVVFKDDTKFGKGAFEHLCFFEPFFRNDRQLGVLNLFRYALVEERRDKIKLVVTLTTHQ